MGAEEVAAACTCCRRANDEIVDYRTSGATRRRQKCSRSRNVNEAALVEDR